MLRGLVALVLLTCWVRFVYCVGFCWLRSLSLGYVLVVLCLVVVLLCLLV